MPNNALRKSRIESGPLCVLLWVVLVWGCQMDDPCDPGEIVDGSACLAPPPMQTPMPDSGADDSGMPTEGSNKDTFGKSCSSEADCAGGNAPVCAPAPFSVCTQTNCLPGEANEGSCPTGWSCLSIPGSPSACGNL